MLEFMRKKNKDLKNKVMPSSGVFDEDNSDNENIPTEKITLK